MLVVITFYMHDEYIKINIGARYRGFVSRQSNDAGHSVSEQGAPQCKRPPSICCALEPRVAVALELGAMPYNRIDLDVSMAKEGGG